MSVNNTVTLEAFAAAHGLTLDEALGWFQAKQAAIKDYVAEAEGWRDPISHQPAPIPAVPKRRLLELAIAPLDDEHVLWYLAWLWGHSLSELYGGAAAGPFQGVTPRGRPAGEPTVGVHLLVPPDLLARFDSKLGGVPRVEQIRQLMQAWVEA